MDLHDENIDLLRDNYAFENLFEVLSYAKVTFDLEVDAPINVRLIPEIEWAIQEATAKLKIMAKDPLSQRMIKEKSLFFDQFI